MPDENGADPAGAALERWLETALERGAQGREAWLEEEIDDPEVRERVADLVARAEGLEGFLERPAMEALGVLPRERAIPQSIDRYRILRVLGEGGMGVVYLAEQREPVQRQLALKVLRISLTTPEAVARFEAERRLLARLSHPNVAALLDAGTTGDGRRFFAMEWVDGPTLTALCDEKALALEDRIGLFLEVCGAVQYAHQKGILHRDLKPSNVLVALIGEVLVPKVIDFGVARTLDAEATLGAPVGTPAYMAPESFPIDGDRADPDVRSDVYSLGILLCELLCGARPHAPMGSTPGELLWEITQGRTRPPSERLASFGPELGEAHAACRGLDVRRLGRRLKGDLDAIVLRATARGPEDRYPTVEALAADLRRHLRLEPVEAARSSTIERFARLARRHRPAFVASVFVLLALVAGTVGTTLGMLRAEREAQSARRALSEAEELSRFLTGLFQVSDPDRSRGEDLRVRELLDRAAVEIRSRFPDQPLVRARLERTLGDVFVQLGLYDEARPLLEESLALVDAGSETERRDLAAAQRSLGLLAYRSGRHAEAEEILRRALDTADAGSVEEARHLVALAGLYLDQRRLDEAEPLYRRALAIREDHLGRDHEDVATVLLGLGTLEHGRENEVEAEKLLREALALLERHLGSEHPRVAAGLLNLGLLELATGRRVEAEVSIRRAATIWETVYGRDHPQVTLALTALARIARLEERWDESEALYLRSIGLLNAGYGEDHPYLANALNNLGSLYWNRERYAEAESSYRRALAIQERALGPESPRVGYPLGNLGLVLWKLGDLEAAEPLFRRTLELWHEDLAPGQPEAKRKIWALWGLAGVLTATARNEEAESLYRRALAIADRVAKDGGVIPPVREDFAAFLEERNRWEEASEQR